MNDENKQVIERIRADHPFPWQQVNYPNGVIRLYDAAQREVGIFAIAGFCVAGSIEAAKVPAASC